MNPSPRPFLRRFPVIAIAGLAFAPPGAFVRGAPPASAPPAGAASPAEPAPLSRDPVRFTPQTTFHYYPAARRQSDPGWVFLPPDPPTLGRPVPLANPFKRGEPAPAELAGFVHEIFYPQLAVRLDDGDLPVALLERLHAYRDRKRALQAELRTRLADLRETDAATRDRALAALAAQQAAPLAALEAEAEKLRVDLPRRDLFGQPFETGEIVRSDPAAPEDPAFAWRRAAYFQDGLSLEQRRLLEEFALAGPAALAPDVSTDPHRLRYFRPATASLHLAAAPPPALAHQLDDFSAVKRGLAAELIARLAAPEPHDPAARTEALHRLAAAQAPRFAALDALAESIRRDLAAVPAAPGSPAPPALPPELSARITLYRGHKQQAIRELHALLAADAVTARSIRFRGAGEPEGAAPEAAPVADAPASVAAFERRQAELVGALNREKAAIREALSDYVRATGGARDRKSMDDLLRDFEEARQQQELWTQFRDYQTAVLSPGLSPAQRRLLFDAAIETLAPPLPPGQRAL